MVRLLLIIVLSTSIALAAASLLPAQTVSPDAPAAQPPAPSQFQPAAQPARAVPLPPAVEPSAGRDMAAAAIGDLRSEIEPLFDANQQRDVVFRSLRDKRALIQRKLDGLDSERRAVLDDRDALRREIPSIVRELSDLETTLQSAEDYRQRTKAEQEDVEREVADLAQAPMPLDLADRRRRLESDMQRVEADLQRFNARKEELARRQATIEAQEAALDEPFKSIIAQESYLRDKLNEVESQLSRQLFIESEAASYKQWISGFFAFLVLAVIGGFFWIAARNEKIAVSIFQNQAGLQFITLFSLVIAIILFGVLNILGGKELSALLGAISGYVLGRAATSQVAEQTAEEVKRRIGAPPGQQDQAAAEPKG